MFKPAALALLALAVLPLSASAQQNNREDLRQALAQIQAARSNLRAAEDTILRLLADDGTVSCVYFTTGSWKGKFEGAGQTENEARDALVQDCFAKYPGPKDVVCPNLRGSIDVVCR